MKFSFFIFSLLLGSAADLIHTAAHAGRFGDLKEESKTSERVFPKGFKNDPSKYMSTDLLNEILKPGKITSEQDLYIRRMIRGDKLWIYESRSLNNNKQLNDKFKFELGDTPVTRHDLPVEYRKWNFKVTTDADKDAHGLKGKDLCYTFSIYLFPWDKLEKLPPEEKKKVGDIIKAAREVKTARPRSLSENYAENAKEMISKMAKYMETSQSSAQETSTSLKIIEQPCEEQEKIPVSKMEVKESQIEHTFKSKLTRTESSPQFSRKSLIIDENDKNSPLRPNKVQKEKWREVSSQHGKLNSSPGSTKTEENKK